MKKWQSDLALGEIVFANGKRIRPVFKRNRPAQKIDMDALKKDVEEKPDSFIDKRAERFSLSESGMRYALKRLGFSRKKNTKTSQSQ